MADKIKPRRDHLAVAREAGHGRLSLLSILAGTLTSYGAFAIVAAVAGAVLTAADVETDFRTNDWASSGAVGGLVTALVLLVAYLFGGYVAGRMARRAGLLNGVAVFVLSLVGGAIAGAVVGALADAAEVERNLRSIGVPTTGDEWTDVGVASAIASLAAMLIGAALGGTLGERWHTKLARRAADPAYGPAAEARRRAEREDAAHDGRLQRDELVRRDIDGPEGRGDADDDRRTVDLRDRDDQPRYTAEEWEAMRTDAAMQDDAAGSRAPRRT